jgi:L-ribulose-5-phosphate 4-epimerase
MVAEEPYTGPKFDTVFLGKEIPDHKLINDLIVWCYEFHRMGLAPAHEKGTSGNMSFRSRKGESLFYITAAGLQTKSDLTKSDLVLVEDCHFSERRVFVRGSKRPSSESMMHGFIYQTLPNVHAVFHGHHQWLLDNAEKIGIAVTAVECEYGSDALIASIVPYLGKADFLIIRNHGFLSLGKNMEAAGKNALEKLKTG